MTNQDIADYLNSVLKTGTAEEIELAKKVLFMLRQSGKTGITSRMQFDKNGGAYINWREESAASKDTSKFNK